jgi:solute carrier family 35 protein E3
MPLTTHGRFILNYSLNFASAVLLIYVSKWIFRQYSISSLTLTIFNCFLSGIFATIVLKCLSKPSINIPTSTNRLKTLIHIFIISGSFSGFITFSNLSLKYNTIGTYQLIKLQIPPTLMIIEWIRLKLKLNSTLTKEKFDRDYSRSVLFAFSIIVLGTLVNTYSDLYFHPLGVSYACISVICNALYQALVQGDKASSIYERTRFLQIQSITSAFILLPCWPFTESSFYLNKWYLFSQWNILFILLLCGLLAFFVNISVIWCIKDDAAIGYNMVGQLKTLLIVFVGSALFDEQLTFKQIISILFTTIGCLIYVYITYRTKEYQKSEQSLLINTS